MPFPENKYLKSEGSCFSTKLPLRSGEEGTRLDFAALQTALEEELVAREYNYVPQFEINHGVMELFCV